MHKNYSYLDIKNELKKKIEKQIYKKEEQIPSERTLAREFNLSRSTIRKAIDELVLAGYLIKAPGRGTFVNPKINHNYSRNKTGNILFLRCFHNQLEQINNKNSFKIGDDFFYPQVVAGVDLVAQENNYHCIFKYIYEANIDQKLIREVKEKVDGIICGELWSKEKLAILNSSNLPVVLVSSSVIDDQVDLVEIANFTGGFKLANHLIGLDHCKFSIIGGSENSHSAVERKSGFLEALKQNKIKFNRKNIITNGWNFEDGYQAALEILNNNQKITAVFAVSDFLAMGAISAFKDQSVKIPADISIVGFDDIDMAKQIKPALTTMRVRKAELGKEAAYLLFNKLQNNNDNYLKITVSTEFMLRDSTRKI